MTKTEWLAKCLHWKTKWPVMQPEYRADNETNSLNIYAVLDWINQHSDPKQVLVGDAGSISYAGPTALEAKPGQRLVFSPAQADMGWAVPGAIGVEINNGGRGTICITGDGSFMSNLQELAVITEHRLNVQIVILNNGGYLSIKNTQSKYYEGRVFGTSAGKGLWFPDFGKIADSFGFDYYQLKTKDDLDQFAFRMSKTGGPIIWDCVCHMDQEILPAQGLKNGKQAGLHDLVPFLSDEELRSELLVDL
jgi:acetolactate synthase-1/2/3 large subunit